MTTTSNTNNQGIAHLSPYAGGPPLCGSRRALISVAVADADKWSRICARCQQRIAPKKPKPSTCPFCRGAAVRLGMIPATLKRHFDECTEATNG